MSYKAIIIGASGLIGSEVLRQVCNSEQFNEVVVITRRSLNVYDKKIREVVVNFDEIDSIAREITGDINFSCLGTTRSKTPNTDDYRKIEYDYTLNIAKIALENRVKEFHYVSSLGANKSSGSSYLKLKGEVEKKLRELPFTALHIYQPSYLTGHRTENRLDDKFMVPLMRLLNPLLLGNLGKYKSIPAGTVAKAMINQSLKNQRGTITYPSNIIKQLA